MCNWSPKMTRSKARQLMTYAQTKESFRARFLVFLLHELAAAPGEIRISEILVRLLRKRKALEANDCGSRLGDG